MKDVEGGCVCQDWVVGGIGRDLYSLCFEYVVFMVVKVAFLTQVQKRTAHTVRMIVYLQREEAAREMGRLQSVLDKGLRGCD